MEATEGMAKVTGDGTSAARAEEVGGGAASTSGTKQQQPAFGQGNYLSSSTTKNKEAAVTKFDQFAKTRGVPLWDAMDEKQCCNMELFGDYASFLAHEYKITASRNLGKQLECSTVMGTLRWLLNIAKQKFGTREAYTSFFFTCLDAKAKTEPAQWWKRVSSDVYKVFIKRRVETGARMDHSARATHSCTVRACIAAYEKDGTPEAIYRGHSLHGDSPARAPSRQRSTRSCSRAWTKASLSR